MLPPLQGLDDGTICSAPLPCICHYVRKGDPLQGLRVVSCLTLETKLFSETHALTKQEILLGRSTHAESSRVKGPRRTALPCSSQPLVLW